MKKFLIFCILLVTSLLFNINKTYAMQNTSIFIEYNNDNFKTMYPDSLIEKLGELKETIDNYNIHNHNYVISVNNQNINVSIDMPKTSYVNDFCSSYYILTIQPTIVNTSQYYLYTSLRKGYCKENQKQSILSYNITITDFMNDNTSTFLNNIQTNINRQYSNSGMLLIGYAQYYGYDSDWANKLYILNYYTQRPRTNNTYAYWIYYSSLPVYYSNIDTSLNDEKIEDLCNKTISNYWTQAKIYYADSEINELKCGDSFTTYTNQKKWNEKIKVYYEKDTKSIDMHFLDDIQDTYKIEIESEKFNQNNFTPTDYIFYGEKCDNINGKTCYWEQKENSNSSTITNINYKYEENKIIITFDLDINLENYIMMKLAIINSIEEYSINIANMNNTEFLLDLNQIGHNYTLVTTMQLNNINALYVNSKSGTINYKFYEKRIQEYGDTTYYEYDKINNIVENSISTATYKNSFFINDSGMYTYWLLATNDYKGNFYIQSGDIKLGENSNVALYIAGTEKEDGRVGETSIYMSDEVYFSFTTNYDLTINYGDINENINYKVTNTYLSTKFENVNNQDFGILTDIVEEYEQYKTDWLLLFYSIYDPLPKVLKDSLIAMYFLGLCYGIFIIFRN